MEKVKVRVYMVLKEAEVEVERTKDMDGAEVMSRAMTMVENGQAQMLPTDTRYLALPAE